MFHTAAFGLTGSGAGVAGAFVGMTARTDQYLSVNTNGQFFIPGPAGGGLSPWRIAAAYAMGTTMTVARINNATLRRLSLPSITPVNPGLTIPNLFNVAMFGINGPRLPYADQFSVEADQTGAEVQTSFVWLHDGNLNALSPGQEVFPVQFTSTITTVLSAWTLGNITFAQNLPVGVYRVVGMDVIGTTLNAARLVNPQGGPRPGILGRAANSVFPSNQFRMGSFGTFLEFTSYAQPYLEVYCSSSASIVFTGYLDLVRVG